MLDRLQIFIPFRPEYVHGAKPFMTAAQGIDAGHKGALLGFEDLGVPMRAHSVHKEGGAVKVSDLRHPYESLPSSFTDMAFKVYTEGNYWPGIELKASPAKLLQGHNVFGPESIRKGAFEMLSWLHQAYPHLSEYLEINTAVLRSFDCTYSARVPSEEIAQAVIQQMQNISNGHTKARGDAYTTTAYFGAKDSRLKRIKVYLKGPEFNDQLDKFKQEAGKGNTLAARVFRVMNDERLKAWAANLVRFEVTICSRWLERRGISKNLWDLCKYQETLETLGRSFLRECWQAASHDIFKAFEGHTVKRTDDKEVMAKLRAVHFRMTPKGNISYSKADKLFIFYSSIRELGFDALSQRMDRKTLWRHMKDMQAAGFSKAFLQNLCEDSKKNNVIPLLRFVEVDFSSQRPDWYVEPVLTFERAA